MQGEFAYDRERVEGWFIPLAGDTMGEWFEAENHVEKAHQFYEQGRWDDAARELRQALASDPYQVEWLFNLGLTLEAAAKHSDASEVFGRVFELAPEDGQAAILAGVNAMDADDPARAISWLERAERLMPEDATCYVHRVSAYARLGDHEQAETMFYLAQAIEPDRPDLYSAMADVLLDCKSYDRAAWCLREVARLDPHHAKLHARLAEAMSATGRSERARQLYLLALREDPGDIDTLLDLGDLLASSERVQEAEEKYRRVLELEPDNVEAHFALGELGERVQDSARALEHYEIVLRLDPGYAEARRRIASLILEGMKQDAQPAQRLLRMDRRDFSERPETYQDDDVRQLGELLIDAGMAREARDVCRALVERDPEDAARWHLLALALLESDDLDGGVEAARRTVELDPRHHLAIHNLALVHLRRGRWVRARYWLGRGLLVAPEDPGLRHLRTRMRLALVAEVVRFVIRPFGRQK